MLMNDGGQPDRMVVVFWVVVVGGGGGGGGGVSVDHKMVGGRKPCCGGCLFLVCQLIMNDGGKSERVLNRWVYILAHTHIYTTNIIYYTYIHLYIHLPRSAKARVAKVMRRSCTPEPTRAANTCMGVW